MTTTGGPGPRHMLDVLMAVATAAAIIQALGHAISGHLLMATITVGTVVLFLCSWLGWRRAAQHPIALTWVIAALAVVISLATDTPLGMLSVGVAVLLVVIDHGRAAGAAYVAGVAALICVLMVMVGHSVEYTVTQSISNLALLLLAWLTATAFARLESERVAREDLLTRLAGAHEGLRAAHQRVLNSLDTEKELVLADERARTAREVHDGLGHRLTCIRMGLDFADRSWDTDQEAARTEVRHARTQTQETLAHMRIWVRALNPPRVNGISGAAAFDDIAEAFRGTGLQVQVQIAGEERVVPQDTSLFCYRLVQEGLTNALRHAQASQVRIAVTYLPAELRLAIADNGTGEIEPCVSEGFGLRSLRERAEALGGSVQAGPGSNGFLLEASVPG